MTAQIQESWGGQGPPREPQAAAGHGHHHQAALAALTHGAPYGAQMGSTHQAAPQPPPNHHWRLYVAQTPGQGAQGGAQHLLPSPAAMTPTCREPLALLSALQQEGSPALEALVEGEAGLSSLPLLGLDPAPEMQTNRR